MILSSVCVRARGVTYSPLAFVCVCQEAKAAGDALRAQVAALQEEVMVAKDDVDAGRRQLEDVTLAAQADGRATSAAVAEAEAANAEAAAAVEEASALRARVQDLSKEVARVTGALNSEVARLQAALDAALEERNRAAEYQTSYQKDLLSAADMAENWHRQVRSQNLNFRKRIALIERCAVCVWVRTGGCAAGGAGGGRGAAPRSRPRRRHRAAGPRGRDRGARGVGDAAHGGSQGAPSLCTFPWRHVSCTYLVFTPTRRVVLCCVVLCCAGRGGGA